MNSDAHPQGPLLPDGNDDEIEQLLRDLDLKSARARIAWQADMFHCYYWRLFGIMEIRGWKMETVLQNDLWRCLVKGALRLVAESTACTADPLGCLVVEAVTRLEERIRHYSMPVAGNSNVMQMEVDLQRNLENLEVTLSVVYAGIPLARAYAPNALSPAVRHGWRDKEAGLE